MIQYSSQNESAARWFVVHLMMGMSGSILMGM